MKHATPGWILMGAITLFAGKVSALQMVRIGLH
jgi:hypothetical protein